MPRSKKVREAMVVPIKEEAFAAARKLHIYAIPIVRSTSDVRYIAFYRGSPISAVTHYGKVEKIEKNLDFKEVFPSGSALLAREDQPLKVYRLKPLVQLRRKVKKGWSPPISGPRYTDIKTLRKARYLDEVWDLPKEKRQEPEAPPEALAREERKDRPDTGTERKRRKGRGRRKKKQKEEEAEAPAPKAEGPKREERPGKGPKRSSRGKKKKGEAPPDGKKPSVHYIVDGSNVALEARTFKEGGRLRQLEMVVEKLKEAKDAAVTVIVDANLRHHIDRKDDLERMINDRKVLQAPAQADADEFILMTAETHRARGENVVIISNDRYKDYIKRFKPRFNWVNDAQRQFMFVFSPDGSEVLEAMLSIN